MMEQKVRAVLGKDSTKGFKFASYPVDNFGLATFYDSANNTEICATWSCISHHYLGFPLIRQVLQFRTLELN